MSSPIRHPAEILNALRPALFFLFALSPAIPAYAEEQPAPKPSAVHAQTPTSLTIQINLDDPEVAGSPSLPMDSANPPPFDIVPPLSVYESRLMLRNVQKQVRELGDAALGEQLPKLDYMLGAVARYVRWVDETHTTLPSYKWTDRADFKLRSSTWRVYTFKLPKPVEDVNAIALRAHHDDVEIQEISIVDQERRQWNFKRTILVRGDQPGNEVCFLPLPTDVSEITVRCRQVEEDNTNRPRLFVATGISGRPESAKRAVYYLYLARYHLKLKQRDEAIKTITLADQLLNEYQKDRRL